MATTKVCGIETEYGIHSPGPEQNPIAASSVLVNAYAADVEQQIGWDFEDETPGNDARGFAREGSLAPDGGDPPGQHGAHQRRPLLRRPRPPRVLEPRVPDAAGVPGLRQGGRGGAAPRHGGGRAPHPRPAGPVVHKNNSDGKGNSYGCHENYMMDRAVPFAKVIDGVVPHFVSRTLFTGSGKVGTETAALDADTVQYQISQRAEFFEEIVGLETTLKRPIVNTRDEPHADPKRFRRLHVIVGDANLSEIATFLKVGTTAIVLAMVEDDAGPTRDLSLSDPVRALHQVSADLSLTRPLALTDGSTATALEMQWEIFGAARKYAEEFGLGRPGRRRRGRRAGDGALGGVSCPASSRTRPPWPTPWTGWPSGSSCWPTRTGTRAAGRTPGWPHWRCSTTTCGRTSRSSGAWTCARSCHPAQVAHAVGEPPTGTRAWFRGKCLARWPDAVVTANWDSLVFDIGADPLRRVPMMDPLKGTAEHTGALLAESTGPADLLNRLNS